MGWKTEIFFKQKSEVFVGTQWNARLKEANSSINFWCVPTPFKVKPNNWVSNLENSEDI